MSASLNQDPSMETGLTNEPEQPEKKRGRAASTQKPRAAGSKKEKLSARQITGLLYLSHSTAADYFKAPYLALEASEAEQIAAAVVDVMQFYDFEISAKKMAWANLVGVCATIYGLKLSTVLQAKEALIKSADVT